MKNAFRLVEVLLVLALLALAPTACDTTGMTTYYGYGVGVPVGYPGAWGPGYVYGPGWGYAPGYAGGGVVVVSGPPIPY